MEVEGRTDAEIARDRAVEAIGTTQDFELQRALWKAAKKFNQRIRDERADRRLVVGPLPRASGKPGEAATREIGF
jgi:hypothetical protein